MKMFKFPERCAPRFGGTLIELMVVFAIISVALSFFFPLLVKVREKARQNVCAHNLRKIGRADLVHERNHGYLVPARLGPDSTTSREVIHLRTGVERSGASGFTLMLPYLNTVPRRQREHLVQQLDVFDNQSIWPAFGFVIGDWKTPERVEAIGTRLKALVCPSSDDLPQTEIEAFQTWDPIPATGSYAFVAGHRGVHGGGWYSPVNACMVKQHNTGPHLYWTKYSLQQIEDGASNTFSVGEVVESHTAISSNIWTMTLRHLDCFRTTGVKLNTPPGVDGVTLPPSGFDLINGAFASRHPKGAHFVYCDGHVEFINDDIDFDLYQNLSTIAGEPAVRDQIDSDFCRVNNF